MSATYIFVSLFSTLVHRQKMIINRYNVILQ